MKNGFLRVASVAPLHKVADVDYNVNRIIETVNELERKNVDVCVFPELSITGYTCGDLFHSCTLIESAWKGLDAIRKVSESVSIAIIVGLPRRVGDSLKNSAALIRNGCVDFIDKVYLPNYNEFYEKRWFTPGSVTEPVFDCKGVKIGVELCEDLWAPIPPSSRLALKGAEVIFNLSASDDHIGKFSYIKSLISQQSARCLAGYVYASAGGGESTTDVVFLPKTIIVENGVVLAQNDRTDYLHDSIVISDIDIEAIRHDRMHNTTFHDCAANNGIEQQSQPVFATYDIGESPEFRYVNPQPFVPPTDSLMAQRCEEILTIQEAGLSSRLLAIGNPKVVVGISGGL
ncbi:MAG: NAD(+) synthase, partial [Paramuribaculum sp.]|nr:NAD(+) synthase [Paramuribaculum sp.]